MKECKKCSVHGLSYKRNYDVSDFVEGYPESPIWIIGLNPGVANNWIDNRSTDELATEFYDLAASRSYFRDFRKVSEWLYALFGIPDGVAHTDLVKCSSPSWPPEGCGRKAVTEIVDNCAPFLNDQIKRYKPSILVCNGAEVCDHIQRIIPPQWPDKIETSYLSWVEGRKIWIVMSGFIGRIDNYARRRLGIEIEQIAEQIGVKT